ncbi:MAG: hypothetical protein GY738_04920 [Pseudoalteromonas sp.]|nr:hypothetical protein [Pseudoalteromonas sp.]
MKLTNYIKEHHNNSQSEFARSQGVRHDQVARWLKRNCMVVNGVVYCEVSKHRRLNKRESKE